MGKPIKYCSLCGEQLEFYFKHDCDHMGPMSSGHWEQKEHTCKSSLKKMCLNCEFYTNSCNNEKVKQTVLDKINTVVKPFTIISIDLDILMTNYREHCSLWKLSDIISRQLFK